MRHRGGIRRSSVIAAVLFLVVSGSALGEPLIVDVRTLGTVSVDEMVKGVKESDIVFVGESHFHKGHHDAQLAVIRGLHDSGDRVAIGLEMFRASSQKALDEWVAGSISEQAFMKVFSDNWSGEYWPLYRPIFAYARAMKIPMVGLNIDRGIVRQVSRNGMDALPAKSDFRYRAVSCDPGVRYRRSLNDLGAGHMNADAFVRFCEAQMLWDSAMAWALIDHARENPGVTTIVLAGTFHSWKHGIPERVRSQSPVSYKVILPSGEKDLFRYDVTTSEADYVWWFGA